MKRHPIGWVVVTLLLMWTLPAASQSLNLPKSEYVVGEEIVAEYVTGSDRDTPRPWVGVFRISDSTRLTYTWLSDTQSGIVSLRAPAEPGTYELRMVRGDDVIARSRFETIVTPVPQALTINKREFVVGETLEVQVTLPEGRYYYYPWIGLFQPGDAAAGGAAVGERRLHWQNVQDGAKLSFTVPSLPGRYELRLHDRNREYYILDTIQFSVYVNQAPGALALNQETFTVGEPISLFVDLPEGRHLYYPWIGLYTTTDDAPGGAQSVGHRVTHRQVSADGELTLNAPHLPGRYEFRLYDRNEDRYVLDSISFDVEVPPLPGALSLDTSTYVVGEEITLRTTLPSGRYYHYPWIGLFSLTDSVAGGARIDPDRLTSRNVPEDGLLRLQAPTLPGRYEFRLYDRNENRFLLDTIQFDVEVTPTPGAIRLTKDVFIVGETIDVSTNLEANRHYHYPWVGMFTVADSTEAGAPIDPTLLTQRNASPTERLTFTAPPHPGTYEFRLYDRNSNRYLLDRTTFQVVAPPALHLAV